MYCALDGAFFVYFGKVFRSGSRDFCSSYGYMVYELKKAVEKYNETAEYKIDKISAHTLRHTGCTRDAEDGMDIKVLQYLMGHFNTQITNNVYNHVNEERAVSEVVNVAERRIFTPILHQSCVKICEFMTGYVKLQIIVNIQEMPKNKDLQTYNKLHEVHKTPPQPYNNVRNKRKM